MKITNQEKVWNLISLFVFVLLLVVAGFLLTQEGIDINRITWSDLILLSIATYRMIRLMVYDRIFKLFRDIIRSFEGTGLGDSLKTIITCPWCAGVWISLVNVIIFYLVPFGHLFIYIMSIAGIATFLQLGSNIAGLVAAEKQIDVDSKKGKTGFYNH